MTSLTTGAVAVAGESADAAGVEIRDLATLDQLDEASRLFTDIWGNDTLGTELMRALATAGSYVVGAYAGPTLVGASVGFFAEPSARALHSHIAGVRPGTHGVGFALKLHQRAWTLARGLAEVHWTFDPLIARNAYFNLVKLAADPAEYFVNFYGPLDDDVNRDDDSDRLLIRWRLDSPDVVAAAAGRRRAENAEAEHAAGAAVALRIDARRPVRGKVGSGCVTALVAVPRNIEALRSTDPGLAKEWRLAVRETMTGLLADGMRVAGFDPAGWYVLRKTEEP